MNEISIQDLLTGSLESEYPNAIQDIASGRLKFTLSNDEIQLIEKIEDYIHALSLNCQYNKSSELTESELMESFSSWVARFYTGKDADLPNELNSEIAEAETKKELSALIERIDDYIRDAELRLIHQAKGSHGDEVQKHKDEIEKKYSSSDKSKHFWTKTAPIAYLLSNPNKVHKFILDLKSAKAKAKSKMSKVK